MIIKAIGQSSRNLTPTRLITCRLRSMRGSWHISANSGPVDYEDMASRHLDWLKQGRHDLEHARRSATSGDYDWACFAAQQGVEKAFKAVFQGMGSEAWGHSVTGLLNALPSSVVIQPDIETAAMELDKHYIAPRDPNSYPEGAPFEYYTRGEADRAIDNAEKLISFCEGLLARQGEGGGKRP